MLQIVCKAVLTKLAGNLIARTAHSRTVGTAALNHKTADDAVEDQTVIVSLVD